MSSDLSLFGDDEPAGAVAPKPAEPQLAGWLVDSLRKALDARGLVSMELTRGEAMRVLSAWSPEQNQATGSSWADREDDTWIDRL